MLAAQHIMCRLCCTDSHFFLHLQLHSYADNYFINKQTSPIICRYSFTRYGSQKRITLLSLLVGRHWHSIIIDMNVPGMQSRGSLHPTLHLTTALPHKILYHKLN